MAENDQIAPAGFEAGNVLDDQIPADSFGRDSATGLEKIIEEYSNDVARFANRLLGWPGDTDDIVQDVFLAAYKGLKKFRGHSSIKTWLFTITINKCRTWRYKRVLRLKTIKKISSGTSLQMQSGAEAAPMKQEVFERVRKIVTALPLKYREPVVLKYLQELSTAEITGILGITQNTLNVRLSRARKILKNNLADLLED